MATATGGSKSGTAAIPRAPLIALYALAITLGLIPFALVVKSWEFLLLTLVTILIVAGFSTSSEKSYAGESPSAAEITLGLLGASAIGVICGLFGIIFFVVLRLVLGVYDWLIVGVPFSPLNWDDPPAAAWETRLLLYIPGLVVWLFVVLVSPGDAPAFLKKLYPQVVEQQSPYVELIQRPR